MSEWIIAGLGNPGLQYEKSRHNVGFRVLDAYASSLKALWKEERYFNALVSKITNLHEQILVKPQTFMNLSGECLGKLCRYFKIEPTKLIVVVDDTSLEFGRVKMTLDCGDSAHNGLKNISAHLGRNYIRYRIGVGEPPADMIMANFVLNSFTEDENQKFEALIPKILKDIELILDKGVNNAMNFINQKIKVI